MGRIKPCYTSLQSGLLSAARVLFAQETRVTQKQQRTSLNSRGMRERLERFRPAALLLTHMEQASSADSQTISSARDYQITRTGFCDNCAKIRRLGLQRQNPLR